MTSYAIEIQNANLASDYVSLSAKTASGAIRQTKAWLAVTPIADGSLVYLTFFRSSDGQGEYINRGGADFTGKSWR